MKIQKFAVYLKHIRLPKDDHIPILLCFDIKALIVFREQEEATKRSGFFDQFFGRKKDQG
jgi:hypothetical protein